jgi:hypothetical protein
VERIPRSDEHRDISSSPLYLLAVLVSARQSKDLVLERVTRRKLNSLGVRVSFGDEVTTLPKQKGGRS